MFDTVRNIKSVHNMEKTSIFNMGTMVFQGLSKEIFASYIFETSSAIRIYTSVEIIKWK